MMKKNKASSKISFSKSIIAHLNQVDSLKIAGGGAHPTNTPFNNTDLCRTSAEISCYSPCGCSDATTGCDN
jgi:hypothetical protein